MVSTWMACVTLLKYFSLSLEMKLTSSPQANDSLSRAMIVMSGLLAFFPLR